MTLQLNYLQTLTDIGVEKNTTIVFPLPMELISLLGKFVTNVNPKGPFRRRRNQNENLRRSRELNQSDTEITLGMRSILGVFFGLALICGVFFGFGYSLGRGNANKAAAAAQTAAHLPETTLPSAVKTVVDEPVSSGRGVGSSSGADDDGEAARAAKPAVAVQTKPAAAVAQPPIAAQPVPASVTLSKTTVPSEAASSKSAAATSSTAPTSAASTAPDASSAIMVQIAAVSHRADADVLVTALGKLGYSASVHTEPTDALLHVQVGPFATRDEAKAMRAKLLNDGYNAILK